MLRTILIEDERLIADEFRKMLRLVSPDTELNAVCSSVRESIEYLSVNEAPDLIFSDVQLPDGLSFDIFNRVNVGCPIIFVTAYDKFIINSFEYNGIDYLLKPVAESDLAKALAKYDSFKTHFSGYRSFLQAFRQKTKTRIIARRGIENISLKAEDIALIYTEEKLVFAIDSEGKKYLLDKKLAELDNELDKSLFFRANRQYIVNIAFIRSYKTYEKVKLQVDLSMTNLNHHIVVSQEMAPSFRKWISEL